MSHSDATTAICAPCVFDGQQFLREHCVLLRGDKIEAVIARDKISPDLNVLSMDYGTLAPGFIDLQVNGGGDRLFTAQPEPESLEHIAQAHRTKGSTSIMPTVISEARRVHVQAVQAVASALAGGHKGLLGIHLEGPFFNPEKRGAHRADRLRELAAEDLEWLLSLNQFPVMLTLAPELIQEEQIVQLASSGLLVCAGHTGASFEQCRQAAEAGVAGITHLYNAMSPLLSREPGAVGAGLAIDSLWAGIIADGHHVHPAAIRIAQRAKPKGKLILVSDAMATVGGQHRQFELYGESIREDGGRLVNAQGKLAGSAIGMIDAVRYCHQEAAIPLDECLRMASRYPAVIMGLGEKLGKLEPGKRADIVHFDDSFNVHHTWLAGEISAHDH